MQPEMMSTSRSEEERQTPESSTYGQNSQYSDAGPVQSLPSREMEAEYVEIDPSQQKMSPVPGGQVKPRACASCRQLKIRCDPGEVDGPCKRCAKMHRQCWFAEPSRRRRRTQHRVAELEQKIDALTTALTSKLPDGQTIINGTLAYSVPATASAPAPAPAPAFNSAFTSNISPSTMTHPEAPPRASHGRMRPTREMAYVDLIDRNVIDEATAYRAFMHYVTNMSRYFPFVTFKSPLVAKEIRAAKPFLFLSIMTVAAGAVIPHLGTTLVDELNNIFADQVVYRAEKSFEIVQALLVYVIFYRKAPNHNDLNHSQLIHMAIIMALDLGLGRKTAISNKVDYTNPFRVDSIENRKTWLGCYYISTNTSMALRFPPLIRWSPFIEECLKVLETDDDVSKDWLIQLIRLQHIAEEVSIQFLMDDPGASISLGDPKTQYLVKTFEKQLAAWRASTGPSIGLAGPDPSHQFKGGNTDDEIRRTEAAIIKHAAAAVDLYIHEIALHHCHNIDDFRPPHKSLVFSAVLPESDFVTPAHIDSLTICMQSAHAMFDAFLEFDIPTLRSLPNLFFVRNAYAAVALISIYVIVNLPGSPLHEVYTPNLAVETYLDLMASSQFEAGRDGSSFPARAFGVTFEKMKKWYVALEEKIRHRRVAESQRHAASGPSSSYAQSSSAGSNLVPHANAMNDDVMGFNPAEFGSLDFGFTQTELTQMGGLMNDDGWMSFLT